MRGLGDPVPVPDQPHGEEPFPDIFRMADKE